MPPTGALAAGVVQDAAYWRAICPKLHVGGERQVLSDSSPLSKSQEKELRRRLDEDGYVQLTREEVGCGIEMAAKLVEAVTTLKEKGWPPSFIMMYDEALDVTARAAMVAQVITGNRSIMDIQASHVSPDSGNKGFAPHRDRPFGEKEAKEAPASFKSATHKYSNMPKFCTCWIGLSSCQPDNGCLYVVPKSADHGYQKGDSLSLESPNAVAPDQWGLRMSPIGRHFSPNPSI